MTSDTQHQNKFAQCFECEKCKKVFKTAPGLERHLKNTNCKPKNEAKEKKAAILPSIKKKGIRMKSPLKGPQIFVCDGCNEQFVEKRVLQKHQKYCAYL